MYIYTGCPVTRWYNQIGEVTELREKSSRKDSFFPVFERIELENLSSTLELELW